MEAAHAALGPDTLPLLRLLQLASPALPVGAYSYSQGLEQAVEAGAVSDEPTAACWIEDVLRSSVARCEGSCLVAALLAADRGDCAGIAELNAWFLASRESAELRAETVQLGGSLVRLMDQLGGLPQPLVGCARALPEPAYPCAWGLFACALRIAAAPAHAAYLWSWAENQVLAAVKLVPLGQSAGQRILFRLGATIAALGIARDVAPAHWTNFAPGLAAASAAHETQYTRLFRS
jgi:urease accessory protein